MTDDAAYEAFLSAMEERFQHRIATEAHRGIRVNRTVAPDRDSLITEASTFVEDYLFGHEDWASVHATDISDIAREACETACREEEL